MLANGFYSFTEPADYEANLREAATELVTTGPGEFRAILTRVVLGQLHLIRAQEELPSISFITLRPDLLFVAFPRRFDPPPVWGGRELRSGEIVFHSRGERLHQRSAGANEKGLIALQPEHLASWSLALSGRECAEPSFARIMRPSGPNSARLFYLHRAACRLVETSPQTIAHPEVCRALEQELIHSVVSCLEPDRGPPGPSFNLRRNTIMTRFEDILVSHPERPRHTPEICVAIGVTEGILRRCCAEVLGMGPASYLRLRRLKLARTALRKSDPATTTVAAVARQYGFGELGRFAGNYRAAYGESPSTTLNARRRQDSHE